MDVLRVGLGYAGRWTITLRDKATRQPVTNAYTAGTPRSFTIGTAAGVSLTPTDSSIAWADAAAGTMTLIVGDADVLALGVGTFGVSVSLTLNGEPVEVYRAVLKVEPRPGGSPYA